MAGGALFALFFHSLCRVRARPIAWREAKWGRLASEHTRAQSGPHDNVQGRKESSTQKANKKGLPAAAAATATNGDLLGSAFPSFLPFLFSAGKTTRWQYKKKGRGKRGRVFTLARIARQAIKRIWRRRRQGRKRLY